MAMGIAGDSGAVTVNGNPVDYLTLIELRTMSNLLQSLLGTNQAIDELRILRNDQAGELGLTVPVPGH